MLPINSNYLVHILSINIHEDKYFCYIILKRQCKVEVCNNVPPYNYTQYFSELFH